MSTNRAIVTRAENWSHTLQNKVKRHLWKKAASCRQLFCSDNALLTAVEMIRTAMANNSCCCCAPITGQCLQHSIISFFLKVIILSPFYRQRH